MLRHQTIASLAAITGTEPLKKGLHRRRLTALILHRSADLRSWQHVGLVAAAADAEVWACFRS
jgi:hypothetical protein